MHPNRVTNLERTGRVGPFALGEDAEPPARLSESHPDSAPMSMSEETDPNVDETTTDAATPDETNGESAAESKGMPKRLRGLRDAQDPLIPSAVARATPTRIGTALEHAKMCARIASDNKAKDVLLLDLREVTSLVDFFVIASTSSRRQASSLGYELDAEMKKVNEEKLGIEGADEGRWTLVDYGDFVVHIFSEEARAYYSLDELWGDAPRIEWREEGRKGGSE